MLNQNSNESSIPWDDPFWLDDEEEKPKIVIKEPIEDLKTPDDTMNNEALGIISKKIDEINLIESTTSNTVELPNQCNKTKINDEIRNDKSFQSRNSSEHHSQLNGTHRNNNNKQRNSGQHNNNSRNVKQNYCYEYCEDRESFYETVHSNNNMKNNENRNNTITKRQDRNIQRNGQLKSEHCRHVSMNNKDQDFNIKIEIRREISEPKGNKQLENINNKCNLNERTAQSNGIIESSSSQNKKQINYNSYSQKRNDIIIDNGQGHILTDSICSSINQNYDDNTEILSFEYENEIKPDTPKRPTKKVYSVNDVKGKWSNLFTPPEGEILKSSEPKLTESRPLSFDKTSSKGKDEKVNNWHKNAELNNNSIKHDNLTKDTNVRSENSRKNSKNCKNKEKQNESDYPIYENVDIKVLSNHKNNEEHSNTEDKYYIYNIKKQESENLNNTNQLQNRYFEEKYNLAINDTRNLRNEKLNNTDHIRQPTYGKNDWNNSIRKNLKIRENNDLKKFSNEGNILNNDYKQVQNKSDNTISNECKQDRSRRDFILNNEKSNLINTNDLMKKTIIDNTDDNLSKDKKVKRLNNDFRRYNDHTHYNNYKEFPDNRKNMSYNVYRDYQGGGDTVPQNITKGFHDSRDNKNGPHYGYRKHQEVRVFLDTRDNLSHFDHNDERENIHQDFQKTSQERNESIHKHKRNIIIKENRTETKSVNSEYASDSTINNDSSRFSNNKTDINSNLLKNNRIQDDLSESNGYSDRRDRKDNRLNDNRKYQNRKDIETNNYSRKIPIERANSVNTELVNYDSRRGQQWEENITNNGRKNQNSKEFIMNNSTKRLVEEKNNSGKNNFNRNQIEKDDLNADDFQRKHNWRDNKHHGNRKNNNKDKSLNADLERPVENLIKYRDNRRNEQCIDNKIVDDRKFLNEKNDDGHKLSKNDTSELNNEKVDAYKKNMHNEYKGFPDRRESIDSKSNIDKRNYGRNSYNEKTDHRFQNSYQKNQRSNYSYNNGYSKLDNGYKQIKEDCENLTPRQFIAEKRIIDSGIDNGRQTPLEENRELINKKDNYSKETSNSTTTQKTNKNNRGNGHRQRNFDTKERNGIEGANRIPHTQNSSNVPRYNFMSNSRTFEETSLRNIKNDENF